MPGEGMFIDVTGGMVVASHPERPQLPVAVAPTNSALNAVNTIRAPLVAVACWKLPDHFFIFDSSVVCPNSQAGFTSFIELRRNLTDAATGQKPPVTLFGHCDPVGDEVYNMMLGARRARAVYGALTHDVAGWESLYSSNIGGDVWGRQSLQIMLGALTDGDGAPYYDGKADGVWTQHWADCIKHFQEDDAAEKVQRLLRSSIAAARANGALGEAKARAPLFDAYMTLLCRDAAGQPFMLLPTEDFLARGQEKHGKGDLQSCGKLNLQMIFRKGEESKLTFEQQKFENRVNRRVVAYLFKPGTTMSPDNWPCPSVATEPNTAVNQCHARFWSDADKRGQQDPGDRRTFRKCEGTFKCRFYHGIALHSPCEDIVDLWVIRLNTRDSKGELQPLANRRCVARMGAESDAVVIRSNTAADGSLHLPVIDDKTTMTLAVDELSEYLPPPPPQPAGDPDADADEASFTPLTLEAGALVTLPEHENEDTAVKQRLHNLGFNGLDYDVWSDDDLKAAVRAFRASRKPPLDDKDSADDDEFRKELRDEYGDNDEPFESPDNG